MYKISRKYGSKKWIINVSQIQMEIYQIYNIDYQTTKKWVIFKAIFNRI